MKKTTKMIKILGLGIVASAFLTGCASGSGTNYEPYGLNQDTSKNKIIDSREVIINTPEDAKKYTEANEKVLKKLLSKQVKKGYEYLGSLTPEPLYDIDGKPILNYDGTQATTTKGGYMNLMQVKGANGSYGYNDGVKAQSFKILRDQVGFQKGITFSTERADVRDIERTTHNGGNTNGSMVSKIIKAEVNSKITYTLSPVPSSDGKSVHGLQQMVSSKCTIKSDKPISEISCSKGVFHFEDMMDLVVEMRNVLEKNYATEMEQEISKVGLKFK